MPFAARRRHQYWTSDVRYIDHELGSRAYVVSVMVNPSRYILLSALTRSQDLSSYFAVLYAAVERYSWPILGVVRPTPGHGVCRPERRVPFGEQRARLLRLQATPHPRSGEGAQPRGAGYATIPAAAPWDRRKARGRAPQRLAAAGYGRITRPEGGTASPHLLLFVRATA